MEAKGKPRRWSDVVAFHCSVVSLCVSGAALGSYVFEAMEAFQRWGGGVEMALNTALALFFLSAAVLLLSARRGH